MGPLGVPPQPLALSHTRGLARHAGKPTRFELQPSPMLPLLAAFVAIFFAISNLRALLRVRSGLRAKGRLHRCMGYRQCRMHLP